MTNPTALDHTIYYQVYRSKFKLQVSSAVLDEHLDQLNMVGAEIIPAEGFDDTLIEKEQRTHGIILSYYVIDDPETDDDTD